MKWARLAYTSAPCEQADRDGWSGVRDICVVAFAWNGSGCEERPGQDKASIMTLACQDR